MASTSTQHSSMVDESTQPLPIEMVFSEILPKLPAKSLVRFKCVSKSFNSQISTLDFINLHLHHSLASYFNRLLILAGDNGVRIFSSVLDSPDSESLSLTALDLDPFTPRYAVASIIGSCNGILCLKNNAHSFNHLILFNPSTGVSRAVPFHISWPPWGKCFGFGFDNACNGFKYVNVLEHQVVVYCFKTDRWKVIEEEEEGVVGEEFILNHDTSVVINNHLVHCLYWCSSRNQHRIRCFDLCNERWVDDVAMPDYCGVGGGAHFADLLFATCRDRKNDVLDFGVLDGCLCLLTVKHERPMFDVWVMEEYAVKESWVKLVTVPDSCVTRSLNMIPLAYGKGSRDEILIRNRNSQDSKLFWYNIKDHTWRRVGIDGVFDYSHAYVCKGSLVSIPGGVSVHGRPIHRKITTP